MTIVANKKSKYSQCDYSHAILAHKIYNMIGQPSLRDYLQYVDDGLIPNCPITRDDIKAAEDIFGPNEGLLKGKTIRKQGEPVEMKITNLPLPIMEKYQTVMLGADIMMINKICFFVSVSHHIRLGTAEMIGGKKALALVGSVKLIQ